jgi:hypothetical protein
MALLMKRPTMCALATPHDSLNLKPFCSIVADLERALQLYRQAAQLPSAAALISPAVQGSM